MNLDDKLRAVATINDLELVLYEARRGNPRSVDFNTFMREQFESDRVVAEHFPGKKTSDVMSLLGKLHPAALDAVQSVNLGTHPQLVLAVARIVMPGS